MLRVGKFEFQTVITRIRILHYQTQQSFADSLKIPKSTLQSWEYGKAIPNGEHLQRLIDWLVNRGADEEAELLKKAYMAAKVEDLETLKKGAKHGKA